MIKVDKVRLATALIITIAVVPFTGCWRPSHKIKQSIHDHTLGVEYVITELPDERGEPIRVLHLTVNRNNNQVIINQYLGNQPQYRPEPKFEAKSHLGRYSYLTIADKHNYAVFVLDTVTDDVWFQSTTSTSTRIFEVFREANIQLIDVNSLLIRN